MTEVVEFKGINASFSAGEVIRGGHSVRAHLAIIKEADGCFSVVVLNLKGCGSCGDSEDDAIANARNAIAEVVESYKDDQEDVPWVDTFEYDEIPHGAKLKWIMVDV